MAVRSVGADVKVSVFADIACPWCYIGVTRFERAAASVSLATGTSFEMTFRAYELDPDTPSDGMPLVDALRESHGGEADAIVRRVETAGRDDGLEFDFAAAVRANTHDAHRLLTWAAEHAGPGAQRDLMHELWRAHFAEGADVADHDTLAARAGLVGLDLALVDDVLTGGVAADEVRLQRETAVELGIESVPTFVLGDTWVINGTQRQEALERALTELVTSAG